MSTEEAESRLTKEKVDLIISDMARQDHARAGYELLDSLRARGITTPFVIYSRGASASANRTEAAQHKANGSTDHPAELLRLVESYVDLQPRVAAAR